MSCSCEVKNLAVASKAKFRRLFMLVFFIIIASWSSSYAENKRIEELEAALQKLDSSVQAIKIKNNFSSE